MKLDILFKSVVTELRKRGLSFAIAGGFAADIYRQEHRLTQDIDVLLFAADQSQVAAEDVIRSVGMKPAVARKADLDGGPLFAIRKGTTEPWMVVGREPGNAHGVGVDILLPAMPWVPDAVRRAQLNLIDFGFGPLPTMTLEDVIIAKCAALQGAPSRFKDLDDLSSIFSTTPELDMKYLASQMHRFDLVLPKVLRDSAPVVLASVSKDIDKARRAKKRP